jgi:integrase/recombinase XerD
MALMAILMGLKERKTMLDTIYEEEETMSTEMTVVSNPEQSIWVGIEGMLAGQLAPSSLAMYQRDITAYAKYATQHDKDTTNPQTLIAWRNELALSSSMSPNTINRMISAVKRIVKEASTNELLPETIALKFASIDGVKIRAMKSRLKTNARTRISAIEMRKLCEAPDTSTLIGIRDRALLSTLASSGIRASELASLTLSQIRPSEDGKHYFVEICGKTDTEKRDAPLSKEAYKLINEWIEVRTIESDYIFTSFEGRGNRMQDTPMSETGVWKCIVKYAGMVGISDVKPHDFRRFLGTQIAKKDIRKAQKALGHKSIETTARHYVLDELEPGLSDDLY